MSIVEFVKNLGSKAIKGSDLSDQIDATRQSLLEYAVPAYQSLNNSNLWSDKQKVESAWNVKRQAEWKKGMRLNIKGGMFQQIYVLLTKVPAILDGVSKNFKPSGEIQPEGLDYQTAAELQLFAAMKFYVDYSTKLLLLATAYETSVRANSKDLPYVKAEILEIEQQFGNFVQISNFIGKHHQDWSAMIKAIPQVAVDVTGENGMAAAFGSSKLDPLRQNLVATGGWNLIYVFRAYAANRQKVKFDMMKVERQNLELRLLQLKSQLEGNQNAALEKTIAYHEKRLIELNQTIRELEEEYV